VPYDIRTTTKFKEDFQIAVKSGFNTDNYRMILGLLVNGEPLPLHCKDHPLKSGREHCLEPGLFLKYKYSDKNVILYSLESSS